MNLAARMKENYELRQRPLLLRRTPVIIRVDGKSFHTYTRQICAVKPFDPKLRAAMVDSAHETAKEMHGCRAVYAQSDEVSFLLTDYSDFSTDAWFGYNQSKLCSVAASIFTAQFNYRMDEPGAHVPLAFFDARAFNVPREEVVNYFLWRMLDWERNSVMMLGRANFSHAQLDHKNSSDVHEMLHTKGINWAKLEGWQKNGTWLHGSGTTWHMTDAIGPTYAEIDDLLATRIYPGEIIPELDHEHTGDTASAGNPAPGGTTECDTQSTLFARDISRLGSSPPTS